MQQENYIYHSPAGYIYIEATDTGLSRVRFVDENTAAEISSDCNSSHPVLKKTIKELDQYFAGTLRTFSIVLNPLGTPFQIQVWKALGEIPYGETISYATLAKQLGQPDAVRAVANANGKNPLLLFYPCHRVIGSSGELTGYAGGLQRKKLLLELEGAIKPELQTSLNF